MNMKEFERMFSELKESEDEKIRKAIINFLHEGNPFKNIKKETRQRWIAWLEKQGEKDEEILILKDQIESLHAAIEAVKETHRIELEKQSEQKSFARYKVGDTIYYDSFGRLVSFVIANIVEDGTDNPMYEDKDGNSVFQNDIVEQKLADKVEPKFKVGNIIINKENGAISKVNKILSYDYELKSFETGKYLILDQTLINGNSKLWTIQDAKDGDVLVIGIDASTCIFKKLEGNLLHSYIISDGKLLVEDSYYYYETSDNVHPATKEQRDALFAKIKEAGYEWDDEKKELKTVEQKPAWSEEDDYNLQCCIAKVQNDIDNGRIGRNRELLTWLKSLKERYEQLKKVIDK